MLFLVFETPPELTPKLLLVLKFDLIGVEAADGRNGEDMVDCRGGGTEKSGLTPDPARCKVSPHPREQIKVPG